MSETDFTLPPGITSLAPSIRDLGALLLAWANAHDRNYSLPSASAIPLSSTTQLLQAHSGCPACHSEEIEGGSVQIEEGLAHQEIDCQNCNASWRDIYVLSGYDDLDVGDSPPLNT